jgi:hypothetical protein
LSNAVSTVVRGPQAVMSLNNKNLDYDLVKTFADALRGVGMPGTLMSFKQGEYIIGTGNDKKTKKHPFEYVANVPNLMFAWRKWEDGRPLTPHTCYPLIGQALPARKELGDNDESEWEVRKHPNGKPRLDENGQPQVIDPWSQVAILMLRDEKTNELFRFETDSFGGKRAVIDLVSAFAEQGKRQPDKLPVIVMDAAKKTRFGTDEKYFVPVLEIVDWVKATAEDFPEGGVKAAPEAEEVTDAGQGKAQSRAAPKQPELKQEEEAPRARARAPREEVVEEEAPRARARASREEVEDEARPARSRRSVMAA